MIESLIAAEKNCKEHIDILPDKVLWPVGYVFKEWIDSITSTELPRWVFWEVIGELKCWRGTGRYERMNEIARFWFMDFRG